MSDALTFILDGDDVNMADKDDWTPLHHAVYVQSSVLVRALLDHGAVAFAHNGDETPYQLACRVCSDDSSVAMILRKAMKDELRAAASMGQSQLVALMKESGISDS